MQMGGDHAVGPTTTLNIAVTDRAPEARLPRIAHAGRDCAVADTAWDRRVFATLNILFQTTVGKIANVGIPITIAK